ncbi:TetR/AcrR family transcriptional regulator [Paenarthrobacter sp. NPDC090522]|uniref:TetR/AcrR family transcriptional regulator n=1 Tax=Paenarthrobacter sp. NPDC090522 TaxID=3364383 RepID=UPI0038169CBE
MRIPAEERREQLIAATVEIMRRQGVQGVTIRAIAKEANAPLAIVSYCFDGKDQIMDAAAEAWLRNFSRFSRDAPVHLGLRKAVESVAEGYWRALVEEPANILAEIEMILWATRNAPESPLAAKIYPAYIMELGNIFASAAMHSSEESRIDIPLLVSSFLMIFDGAAIQYMTDPTTATPKTMYFMMIDALLTKTGL